VIHFGREKVRERKRDREIGYNQGYINRPKRTTVSVVVGKAVSTN